MCAILGVVRRGSFDVAETDVERALGLLQHRGPDDQGLWRENGVTLGHRRLSILDLSPAGHQPMHSACGRYVLTYNGEIYNFSELRAELESCGPRRWRGSSDTEVLLELIAACGLEAALQKANGMFALALWDRAEQRLWLARDRFGEKPLFYTLRGEGFAFASEITALEAMMDLSIDMESLARYFVRGYFPAPDSIFTGVHKLPPGCFLTWRSGEAPVLKPYWQLDTLIREQAPARQAPLDEAEAVEQLDALIHKATALRMTADVPIGVFLSGGVDSSLVAAAMQNHSQRPITTFTLGFEDPRFNEAAHAREVAIYLGTHHIEETVTPARALDVVSELGRLYDEPLCDDSQIPTYLVSAMARKHVKVALSGDGGDEFFGGYRRYRGTPALWNLFRRIPFTPVAGAALRATPAPVLDMSLGFLKDYSDRLGRGAGVGQTLHRISPWMKARSLLELHEMSLERWPHTATPVSRTGAGVACWPRREAPVEDELDLLCWHDQHNYLPGDILTKVDRASMATSLETRIPLLDPEIAAFSWRLPAHLRREKAILKAVLQRHVPAILFDRPKSGFSPPLEAWLRGPLKSWADDLLSPERLRRQGFLDEPQITAFWKRYQAGGTLEDFRAWGVLMFQAWLDARGM